MIDDLLCPAKKQCPLKYKARKRIYISVDVPLQGNAKG